MNIFQDVGALKPRRTKFNLSYFHRYNCNMGELIPSYIQEAVPGDVFHIGLESLTRTHPLISPVLDNIYMVTEFFFVPTRLLWDKWEEFITGIKKDTIPPEEFTDPQPEWSPADMPDGITFNNSKFSLWDYFGFPVGIKPTGAYPLAYPLFSYNKVYNDWYRDENLQELVSEYNQNVLYRSWRKDYFTSALPFRQKGIAPSIPLTGQGSAFFDKDTWPNVASGNHSHPFPVLNVAGLTNDANSSNILQLFKKDNSSTDRLLGVPIPTSPTSEQGQAHIFSGPGQSSENATAFTNWLNTNNFDLSNVGTFTVSDLRDMFQLQKWMERNARGGTRYIEFLKAHFFVSPSDARLDRSEFICSIRTNLIISEVPQTSQSTDSSPQGSLAGKGLGVTKGYGDTYYVEEYGWIIGLTTVYPRPSYQQGINRMFLRKTRLEQFYPEFVNLSEQGIKLVELYAQENETENHKIFGYTGIYDEMRIRHNQVSGDFRDILDYWVLTRKFTTPPALNSDFIMCKPSNNIFAVQDEPPILVNIFFDVSAIRPLPEISEPGLIDHH